MISNLPTLLILTKSCSAIKYDVFPRTIRILQNINVLELQLTPSESFSHAISLLFRSQELPTGNSWWLRQYRIPWNGGDVCNVGDLDLIPGSGRSSTKGNGNPLQYSCLGNPMDRGAWGDTIHGITRVGHNLGTEAPLHCYIRHNTTGGLHPHVSTAPKSLQSCPTLHDPLDGSPLGFPVPGILQARTLEWVAISFSKAWKWKVKVKSLSHVRLFTTPWTAAHQAPPSMGFSRQENWSGVPLPSPHVSTGRVKHLLRERTPPMYLRKSFKKCFNQRDAYLDFGNPFNHFILLSP